MIELLQLLRLHLYQSPSALKTPSHPLSYYYYTKLFPVSLNGMPSPSLSISPSSLSASSSPPLANDRLKSCACTCPAIATKLPEINKSNTSQTPYRFCSSCDTFMGFVRVCSADLPHQKHQESSQWGLRRRSVLEPVKVDIRDFSPKPSPPTSPMTICGAIAKGEGEAPSIEKDDGGGARSPAEDIVPAKRKCPFPPLPQSSLSRHRPFNRENTQEARGTTSPQGTNKQVIWFARSSSTLGPPLPLLLPPHEPWNSAQTKSSINLSSHLRHPFPHLRPTLHMSTASNYHFHPTYQGFLSLQNVPSEPPYNNPSFSALPSLNDKLLNSSPASILLSPPPCPCGMPAKTELTGELGEAVILSCGIGRCGFLVRVTS